MEPQTQPVEPETETRGDATQEEVGPGHTHAGGSAEPHAAGPGVGTAEVTKLTQDAKRNADDAIHHLERGLEHLQRFADGAFDAGEGAAVEILSIVDNAQTLISNLLSAGLGVAKNKLGEQPKG